MILRRFLVAFLCAATLGCGHGLRRREVTAECAPLSEASDYRVIWRDIAFLSPLVAGRTSTILVTVQNTGKSVWPDDQMGDPIRFSGAGAVHLSYRVWNDTGRTLLLDYGPRSSLPWPLFPGDSVTIPLDVTLAAPGRYILELGLVHEAVAWFGEKGAEQFTVPVIARDL